MAATSAMRATRSKKEPAAPKPSAEGISTLGDTSIWESFSRICGSATPQQVSAIFRQADMGQMVAYCDLLADARTKDGSLQSYLGTRELAVAGTDWELVFPGETKKTKRTRGARQKAFIYEALREPTVEFEKLIAHLTGAIYPGWAVAETVTRKDSRGRIVPRRFILQPARRFGFRNDDSKLVWRDNHTSQQDVDFQADWPGRFLVAQPRITGDAPQREGLGRVTNWASLFRNWTIGDWLKLAEIAWKPWRIGKFKIKSNKDDRLALERALAKLTTSGVASLSENVDLQIAWPGGTATSSKPTHSELCDYLGREMAKAILGQTLTSDSGKVGSQALGKVHNEVRHDILEFDARWVASVITRDLIAPLVRANFGASSPIPRFRFITEDSADLESFSKSLVNLGTARMKVPAAWARDQIGMPAPDKGEELVGGGVEGEEPPKDEGPPASGEENEGEEPAAEEDEDE
jgi:phage gp29-like protein